MAFNKCPCLRIPEEDVTSLDYRHAGLDYLPSEVFHWERTLEELVLDANRIRELPRELFYCHGLRKLSICDNELTAVPAAIDNLQHLHALDISRNGIVDLPDTIKCCKHLFSIEASVNPLGKLPEGFTQLPSLTELYLNDTFLDYLPGSFGRLTKLRILEIRENHFKTLPKSLSRLTCLERLDIGNNEFTELPEVVGNLISLLELWCDHNQITTFPASIGNLKQLIFLDASKNRLEQLPPEIDGCISLADLHLSTNLLQQLPENIGRLSNLTTLKVDDNRLTSLPFAIGGLVSMSEFNVSCNDLETIPHTIGFLRHLRTFYADENFFYEVPPELGSCNGITVLSLRSNNLEYLPDEIGRIPRLRVLNLSDNKIRSLPYSFIRLKELQALWLAENQTKPLIRLQQEIDPNTGQRRLTCYLLPQQQNEEQEEMYSDADSFHPSLWEEEREQRVRIHFDFDTIPEEEPGHLQRHPTPYPKEMKFRAKHMQKLALKQLNVQDKSVPAGSTKKEQQDGEEPEAAEAEPDEVDGPVMAEVAESARNSRGVYVTEDSEGGFTSRPSAPVEVVDVPQPRPTQSQGVSASMERNRSPPRVEGRAAQRRRALSQTSLNGSEQLYVHSSKPSLTDLNANVEHHSFTQSYPGLQHSNSASSVPGVTSQSRHQRSHHNHHRLSHPSRHPPRHSKSQRSRGYDSDTGYRSDAGYRSEGCRSDIAAYGPYRAPSRPSRRGGYSSDIENAGRHGRRNHAFASDAEVESDSKPRFRPISAAPQNGSIPERHPTRPVSTRAPRLNAANYSNAPKATRSSLRNDEMYEQYRAEPIRPIPQVPIKRHNPRHSQHQRQSSDSSSHNAPSDTNMQLKRTIPETSHYATPSKPPPKVSTQSPINQQGALPGGTGLPRTPSMNCAPLAMDETLSTGSADDDAYKAQLYQASVKLQKTPSEKRKTRPHVLHSPSSSKDDDDPFMPPSYQPAPPYTAQDRARATSQTNLHSGHDAPASPPSPFIQRPYRTTGTPCPPIQTLTPSKNMQPSPRPHDSSIEYPTPSRSRTLPVTRPGMAANTSLNQSWASIPVNSSSRVPAVFASQPQLNLSHGYTQFAQGLQGSPRPAGIPEGYATPRKNEAPTLHVNTSFSSLPAGHSMMPSPGTPQRPPLPAGCSPRGLADRLPVDAPLHVTHYEQDVALYKPSDPASQVSSSTDSGYGHNHCFDRMQPDNMQFRHADALNSSREQSPFPTPLSSAAPTPYRSSPCRDSGVGAMSRESTPGFSPSSGKPSPAASPGKADYLQIRLCKNPGLGFSIAGGRGSPGNPFKPQDNGIFVTKVQHDGPAATLVKSSDKILEVNGIDFRNIDHADAVRVLRNTDQIVQLILERV